MAQEVRAEWLGRLEDDVRGLRRNLGALRRSEPNTKQHAFWIAVVLLYMGWVERTVELLDRIGIKGKRVEDARRLLERAADKVPWSLREFSTQVDVRAALSALASDAARGDDDDDEPNAVWEIDVADAIARGAKRVRFLPGSAVEAREAWAWFGNLQDAGTLDRYRLSDAARGYRRRTLAYSFAHPGMLGAALDRLRSMEEGRMVELRQFMNAMRRGMGVDGDSPELQLVLALARVVEEAGYEDLVDLLQEAAKDGSALLPLGSAIVVPGRGKAQCQPILVATCLESRRHFKQKRVFNLISEVLQRCGTSIRTVIILTDSWNAPDREIFPGNWRVMQAEGTQFIAFLAGNGLKGMSPINIEF